MLGQQRKSLNLGSIHVLIQLRYINERYDLSLFRCLIWSSQLLFSGLGPQTTTYPSPLSTLCSKILKPLLSRASSSHAVQVYFKRENFFLLNECLIHSKFLSLISNVQELEIYFWKFWGGSPSLTSSIVAWRCWVSIPSFRIILKLNPLLSYHS